MATVTPNFNWPVPTSTDLVKDGATAIEALGDSIDGSLVDLKGGTTGQVLSKTSGTDMDFTWVTTDDANAIQNSIVDAKGDLIAATANDTPARLAVGANDLLLTAASGEATGLKYTGAWTSYTPTFTNFTLGNGNINYARWCQIAKVVYVRINVGLGSTSVMSSYPALSLPKTAAYYSYATGQTTLLDSGTAYYNAVPFINTATTVEMNLMKTNGTYLQQNPVTSNEPFVWTTNDAFWLDFYYEVA